MRFLRQSSAVILGLIVGVIGFMIYHKQTNLPLADVMSTQNPIIAGDMSYQLYPDRIVLSNTSTILIGTLKLTIAYDTDNVSFLTDQITSPYEYSFDSGRGGMMTVFVNGTIQAGQVITIPLQGDSSSISIASPQLISNDSASSLSLTRIE